MLEGVRIMMFRLRAAFTRHGFMAFD